MRVLVADKIPNAYLEQLRAGGHKVDYLPDLKAEEIAGKIKGVEAVVVRSTKVKKDAVDAADALKLVVRAGSGVDTIDIASCTAKKVYVTNCPGKNSIAVAELAMGLILALDRRIPDNVAQLRAHKWNKKEFSKARGLAGRTLGIIGIGRIGREVAARAKAFAMEVIAWDIILTEALADQLGVGFCATKEEIAEKSDIVTIHVPETADSKKLVDAAFIAKMKPGAMLINTSRGGLLDQKALTEAVRAGKIRAGLDVYEGEPADTGDFADPLLDLPGFYGTHHIGASTDQAQDAVAEEMVRIVDTFGKSGKPLNCVNADKIK
jgi:D-3-phosphoglycerate dehydrogenase